MNILFVTYNTCARAAKEAKALASFGHQVVILQHVAVSEEILYATEIASFYSTEQSMIERIAYFGDWVEAIHVHNEPNWMVSTAAIARNMACPLVPIVFDIHDLDSQREDGSNDPTEGPAIHAADGFIFPSRAYERGVRHVWNTNGAPGRVIYSYCSKQDIVSERLPRVNGLVYEGAMVAPLKNFNPSTPGYKKYRDYTALAQQLTFMEMPFHLYGVRKEFQQPYLNAGAIVHDMHRFPDMMRQLTRYDWGLCGHLGDHPQWQKAMPNKLFEYIAAGIPVISINAGEVSEFLCMYGLGEVAESVKGIANLMQDRKNRAAIAEMVEAKRGKFTMENQVPEIEALYAEASAYRKNRLDDGLQVQPRQAGAEVTGRWVCGPGAEDCA